MGRTSPSVWCCGWHQLSFSLESTLNLSAAKGVSPNSILTCSLSSDSPVSMWEFLSCMQCLQSLILTLMVFIQCFLQVLPFFTHFSAEKKNRAIFTSAAEVTPALQPNESEAGDGRGWRRGKPQGQVDFPILPSCRLLLLESWHLQLVNPASWYLQPSDIQKLWGWWPHVV